MSAVNAPFGVAPISHPSGEVRIDQLVDGIASAFGTSIFTNTPITRVAGGGLEPTGNVAADKTIGVFMGCEFSALQRRFVLPYFPAGQTYDAGSMIAYFTSDKDITYQAQANGPITLAERGAGINLANTSQGSTFTGQSTQSLGSSTGATPGTYIIQDVTQQPNNTPGDAFTVVNIKIDPAAYAGPI